MAELPLGYEWVECPKADALACKPQTWSLEERQAPDGRTNYLMMFEDPEDDMSGEIDVGMIVTAMRRVRVEKNIPAVLAAKQMVDVPPTLMPETDTEMVRSYGLTTFRRIMHVPGGLFGEPVRHGPSTSYISATGDNKADVLYVATFNTPPGYWSTFEPIARVMIENVFYGAQREEIR